MKTRFEKAFEDRLRQDKQFKKRHELDSVAYDISVQIYKARTEKKLTQTELAKRLNIRQSNIARLENGEYVGYSLSTLSKIANALDSVLTVSIAPKENSKVLDLLEYIKSENFRNDIQGLFNGYLSYTSQVTNFKPIKQDESSSIGSLVDMSKSSIFGEFPDSKNFKINLNSERKSTEDVHYWNAI